jgi:hypothetical protein
MCAASFFKQPQILLCCTSRLNFVVEQYPNFCDACTQFPTVPAVTVGAAGVTFFSMDGSFFLAIMARAKGPDVPAFYVSSGSGTPTLTLCQV